MKFTKGAIEIATVVGIGLGLVIAFVFFGIVVPSVLNTQQITSATTYTNHTVNMTNNNNATFIGNGSGTYKTLQLVAPVQPYSETATNSTTDLNGTCNLTRGVNYTINYGSGLVNLTNVWTSAPCGLATLPTSGVYSFNYSGSYNAGGNWTAYGSAAGLADMVDIFVALLLLVAVVGSMIALLKAAGIM